MIRTYYTNVFRRSHVLNWKLTAYCVIRSCGLIVTIMSALNLQCVALLMSISLHTKGKICLGMDEVPVSMESLRL